LNFEGGIRAAAAVSLTAGAKRSGCSVDVRYVKSCWILLIRLWRNGSVPVTFSHLIMTSQTRREGHTFKKAREVKIGSALKYFLELCRRNYRQDLEMYILQMLPQLFDQCLYHSTPVGRENTETYHMLRLTPVAHAKQVKRRFQHESYPLLAPNDTPQLVVFFCKDGDESLSDAHEVRYRVFGFFGLGAEYWFPGVGQDVVSSWSIRSV
jgi:hypothetical protein